MTVQDSMSENMTVQHSMEKGDLPMTGFLVVNVCVCDFVLGVAYSTMGYFRSLFGFLRTAYNLLVQTG